MWDKQDCADVPREPGRIPVRNWCQPGLLRSEGRSALKYSPLLDNGISLISIYQGRGNRHAYGAVSLGQLFIEPGHKIDIPTEDAMESHCGRTILRFWVVTLEVAVV